MTASAWLMRALVLRKSRLVSTTGPAEGARFPAPPDAISRAVFATVSLASIIPTSTAEHKSGQSGAKLRDSARSSVEAGISV